MSDPFAALDAAIVEARADELPAIIAALEAARAKAWARLMTPVASPPADHMLTMPQVAARLGVTEHQAREMGRRHELPVVTVGERFVRVRAQALDDWIRRRERANLLRPGGR